MGQNRSYLGNLFYGIKTLLKGFSVTGKEFFTKKVTEEYPDNRDTLKISPFRFLFYTLLFCRMI